MSREILDDVFKSVEGGIHISEGRFLYDLAKNCSKGVIVDIGAHHGLSTLCMGLGSKEGHGVKVYSIDPRNLKMRTPDIGQNVEADNGHPDKKYYVRIAIESELVQFKENLKKYGIDDYVIPIVDYSEPAYWKGLGKEWDLPVGLLFIDGDHRYNYVKMDLELWGKHVISGGIIVMHDMVYPGVFRTIKEMIRNNPRYSAINDDISGALIFNVVVK